jgi:hypothetical protein
MVDDQRTVARQSAPAAARWTEEADVIPEPLNGGKEVLSKRDPFVVTYVNISLT